MSLLASSFNSSKPYNELYSSLYDLLNWRWWVDSIVSSYKEEPLHLIIECICLAIIVFLLIKRSYDPRDIESDRVKKLPLQIQDELLSTWQPQPLVPKVHIKRKPAIVQSIADRYVTIENFKSPAAHTHTSTSFASTSASTSHTTSQRTILNNINASKEPQDGDVTNGVDLNKSEGGNDSMVSNSNDIADNQYLNFSSYNFLSLVQDTEIKHISEAAVTKYGVGSCGPRGFYGTFDVHLALEKHLTDFYAGAAECILYSDGIACVSSVIPAFCKRGDWIVADEAVHYGIQQGLLLSRSTVKYYKHNDMVDLERVLKQCVEDGKNKKLNRRFIVTEGLSQYYGDLSPLDTIVALKNKYKFRLLLDDSLALGVLGEQGRGTIQHFNVDIKDVDIFIGTLDTSLSSVGGFCLSAQRFVVDHQRITSAGYVFSATSPPYTAAAASMALEIIQREPSRGRELREKARYIRGLLKVKSNHSSETDTDRVGVNGNNSLSWASNAPTSLELMGDCDISPLIYVRIHHEIITHYCLSITQQADIIDEIIQVMLSHHHIACTAPDYVPFERRTPPPAIRIVVCYHHTKDDLQNCAQALHQSFDEVLNAYLSRSMSKHLK